MRKWTAIHAAAAFALGLCPAARPAEYRVGPFVFTNTSAFEYPQFDPASGYLHSITFDLTNVTRSFDIVCDNDSPTNVMWFGAGINESIHLAMMPTSGISQSYWLITTPLTFFGSTFAGTDDGDRFTPSYHNGGTDEYTLVFTRLNLTGRRVVSDPPALTEHTGHSNRAAAVNARISGYLQIGPPSNVEWFQTNQSHGGECYVRYTFEASPVRPRIVGFALSETGLWLDIQGTSAGSSNTIQRGSGLTADDWTNAGTFQSSGSQTNWSGPIEAGTLYRVLSE